MSVVKSLGIRAFYGLNPDNNVKYSSDWIDSMLELELKAAEIEEFRKIAFFNHILLKKL